MTIRKRDTIQDISERLKHSIRVNFFSLPFYFFNFLSKQMPKQTQNKSHSLFYMSLMLLTALAVIFLFIKEDGRFSAMISEKFKEASTSQEEPTPEYSKSQFIVKLKVEEKSKVAPGAAPKPTKTGLPNIDNLNKKNNVSEMKRLTKDSEVKNDNAGRAKPNTSAPDLSTLYKIKLNNENSNIEQIVQEYNSDPSVEYAELDYKAETTATPNDPYYLSQGTWGQAYYDLWGIRKINSSTAWDINTGSKSIIVADIDTGVDYNHEDISSNIWTNPGEIQGNSIDDDNNGYVDDYYGYDFYNEDGNPIDDHGHGTHTVGTIMGTGNNSKGVVGVNWTGKVMAVKFLSAGGSGWYSDAVSSIDYAVNNGANVLSNSWGGWGSSQSLQDAVDRAYAAGAVFVAAAGNSNWDASNFQPAGLNNVITVAATDANDAKASFSNYGEKIDVAAPGVDTLSLRANGTSMGSSVGEKYTRASGTSMACPHVAGLAALILSKNPSMTNAEVEQTIEASAEDLGSTGFDIYFGNGRIDAGAAISGTKQDTTPPSLIQNFNANSDTTYVNLTWTNPDEYDFLGVKILRNTSRYPIDITDGTIIYDGSGTSYKDTELESNTTYYYSAFSYDRSANYSSSAKAYAKTSEVSKKQPTPQPTPQPVPQPSPEPTPDPSPEPAPGEEDQPQLTQQLVTGPELGGSPHVRTFNNHGSPSSGGFYAFKKTFKGGIRIASGDIDGDNEDEIIAGAGPGGGPHVRIFEKSGQTKPLDFFPFHTNSRSGVDVAAGDVDGDGKDEIAVSQFKNAESWIKVYKYNEKKEIIGEWRAFGEGEEHGATVAMGDVDNDGKAEVIVGAGEGGGPQIQVYEANGERKPIQFFAFHPDSRSGVDVSAADTDGDGKAEIGVTQLEGAEAWTKVYRYNNEKTIVGEWRSFPRGVECGANIDLHDLTGDGRAEAIVGPNAGGGPQIRTFKANGSLQGSLNFFAYAESLKSGIDVSGGNFY